jgi:6-phosphofructokinase 2
MNPAIDVSTSVDGVAPVRKLRCVDPQRDPGGGGLNVARVVSRLGAKVTAVYPMGGLVGQRLEQMLEEEGVKSLTIPILGDTREDFTVHDDATGQQYRFVFPGPRLSKMEWQACLKALATLDDKPDFVCASGSLPPGVPDDFYARVARIVSGWDARLVLDTSGAALRAGLQEPVYLIKPNLQELCELAATALEDQASMIKASRSLIARGRSEAVALTLGAEGALLVTADRAWRARSLPVQVVSTVGTGDSFLGGMIWALASKMTLEQSFHYAVAAGSAAVLAPGTGLCRPQDVRRLLGQVVVDELAERRTALATD